MNLSGIPDHADQIPLIHRRVPAFDRSTPEGELKSLREEIPLLRCLSIAAVRSSIIETADTDLYDVHTSDPFMTVVNGRIGLPPVNCQGLSITPFHADNQRCMREEDNVTNDCKGNRKINGEKIRRFFCYSTPSATLNNLGYRVNYDEPGHHAHVYSPNACSLDQPNGVHEDDIDEIYRAYLPDISNLPWTYCCSLLNCTKSQFLEYQKPKPKGQVKSKVNNKSVQRVHDILSDHCLSTQNLESCDKSREIMEWIEKMPEMAFEDLVHFPGGFQWVLRQVFDHHLETEDVRTADYAYAILNDLKQLQGKS